LNGKHITLIGLNFFPEDTAIGLYSTQLANFLKEKGAAVTVVTAFPYYPQWEIAEDYKKKKRFLKEAYNGMTVYRYKQYTPAKPTFLKRVFHIIDFTMGSYRNMRKIKKCDYVISIVPFTSSAFLGNMLKRRLKAKHWIHIQDFEFDAAFQSGLVQTNGKNKGIIHRFLMGLERRILSRADRTSTISKMMLQRLSEKTTTPTYYLPNWIEANEINPAISGQHPFLKTSKFKILYSGNIGDKQDWDFFIEVIDKLDTERFEVIVVGDGSKRAWLEAKILGRHGIMLYPPIAYEDLSSLLCSADVHLLFQKTDILDTVMPSKILGMMASARPSIITGHPRSEVAHVVKESRGGYYHSERDADFVIKCFNELAYEKAKAAEMGNSARAFVTEHFSKDYILSQFVETLSQV
jgi:colanic acid biosynthesis glycosyl transferase WcaI